MESKFNFVRLTPLRGGDFITVGKNGLIGFSVAFCERNKISQNMYASLFYDKNKKALGIYFSEDKKKETYMKVINNHSSKQINCGKTLKLYGILQSAGRYQYEIEEIEGIGKLFIIQLT